MGNVKTNTGGGDPSKDFTILEVASPWTQLTLASYDGSYVAGNGKTIYYKRGVVPLSVPSQDLIAIDSENAILAKKDFKAVLAYKHDLSSNIDASLRLYKNTPDSDENIYLTSAIKTSSQGWSEAQSVEFKAGERYYLALDIANATNNGSGYYATLYAGKFKLFYI